MLATLSAGVAVFPDHGRQLNILLNHAEKALHEAKRRGGSTQLFFSEDHSIQSIERINLENSLRKALASDELVIYYQPKVSLADGSVIGVEALLRWFHPDLGLVPPAEFIPLAEETGLIVQLGQFALERAAADVDLVHGVLDVHKAIDGKTGKVHAPKTPAGARLVPIEPALRPLLEQLVTEAGGGRLLAWVPAQREAAKMLRRALQEAGVRREALFADDAHRAPVTFHDLRATGITWCAVRGDEVLRLQQRAGHEDVATTQGYVREAENLRAHYGAVFAPLPPVLLVGSVPEVVSPTTARERSAAQIPGPDVVPAAGLEPTLGGF